MGEPSVLEIEEAAFHAWPADEVLELSGWRLRFMHGVTHRGNSVWPNGWGKLAARSRSTSYWNYWPTPDLMFDLRLLFRSREPAKIPV